MSWPTPQDYNEAIQNPGQNFEDPELRAGDPELTPLGLPRPITGNFASVYRIRCQGRDWAVRCFWREFADMQHRYLAISRHLSSARLTYTVGFDYLPRGIRVRGAWFPILKMEWVEGQLLSEYVEQHVRDAATLRRLADRWVEMVKALERASVAHGDLQHGNVLVVQGELRLVDYDGMWVPALTGRSSHEIGHPNYQHPGRSASDFGPGLDRFSAWVIYLSLAALSVQPDLWSSAGGGDECLILRKGDFADPRSSQTLAALEAQADQRLQAMIASLRSFAADKPSQVPSLTSLLEGPETAGSRRSAGKLVGVWRRAGRRELEREVATVTAPGAPGWVLDSLHSRPAVPRGFVGSPTLPRSCAAISGAVALAAWLPGLAPLASVSIRIAVASLLVMILNVTVLSVSFKREPATLTRSQIAAREKAVLRDLAAVRRRIDRNERAKSGLAARGDRARAGAAESRARLAKREQRRRAAVEADLAAARAFFEAEQAQVDRREQDELSAALKALQEQHVRRVLSERDLWSAEIPGVGWWDKLRLWTFGIRSAGHVRSERGRALRWVGEEKSRAVLTWRHAVEGEARRTAPRRLDADTRDAIRRRHAAQRDLVFAALRKAEAREQRDLRTLGDAYGEKYAAVEARLLATEEALARRCEELEEESAAARREEPLLRWRLAYIRHELEPYEKVTMPRYLLAVFTGARRVRERRVSATREE